MSIIRLCRGETNAPFGNWPKHSHDHFINETSGLIGFKKQSKCKWVSPQAFRKLQKHSLKDQKGFMNKNQQSPEKSDQNRQKQKPLANNLTNLQSKLKKYQSLTDCKHPQTNRINFQRNKPSFKKPVQPNQMKPAQKTAQFITPYIPKTNVDKLSYLKEKKVQFAYPPKYETKKHFPAPTTNLTQTRKIKNISNQESFINSFPKTPQLIKTGSYQHIRQKSDLTFVAQSLKIQPALATPTLKKVVSQKQFTATKIKTPQNYFRQFGHTRQKSEFQIPQQKNKNEIKPNIHVRHNSDLESTVKPIYIREEGLQKTNQFKIKEEEEYSEQEDEPYMKINLIKVQSSEIKQRMQNQDERRIADFNLSVLTVTNLENMDFCRKTQSIHDSSEKQDEFSEILPPSQTSIGGKNILNLPLIKNKNKFSEPYSFPVLSIIKNEKKRKESMSSSK